MTKQEFRDFIKDRIIYLDGATGSNLQKRGMPLGVCPEQWILEHKNILKELQTEYVEAGSNIIYTPTFTCNRIKLEEYGLADHIKRMNTELVQLSKEAAGEKALVAGDLTMTGEQLAPIGTLTLEELITVYKEQITYLAEAGVDLLVVETMMSLQETRAALLAAKEVCNLPVMVTMTFEDDGRALYGTDPVTAAIVLESLGADAIGANCSTGPDKMALILEEMHRVVKVPIIAKPNAGLPCLDKEGNTVYDMPASVFALQMQKAVSAGARILGGCCGTTPEYIKALADLTQEVVFPNSIENHMRYLTSERQTVSFHLNSPFLMIGERINPTGKKKLQEQLKKGNLEMVLSFAEEQESCGAKILDVNMGMGGIDEKAMMLRTIQEVTGQVSLPLSIDTSHVDIMEEALRQYPGRALMNSISLETSKCDPLLLLAKKYGAMFILLPLSDAGLPKDLEEKKQIIDTIMEKALQIGLTKEDIMVDGLVTTVGANKTAAMETLETIRFCKEIGLATTCGLSNISFGLPERGNVNMTFLSLAIQAGLTSAILNPSQELLVNSALSTDLLLNKDSADILYIEAMNSKKEKAESNAFNIQTPDNEKSILVKIYDAVLKGAREKILTLVKEAFIQNMVAKDILNQALLPAINEVGNLFEIGKYFLPQLISSAETMKIAIGELEPLLLQENKGKDMPTIVIATVEGDIHDIGKNLVGLMLKNYGFQVIDLGKDVPKEFIIETALKEDAKIIALSALMTTTMQEMEKVIAYARERGVTASIMVGGAVVTEEYANEIHANGYSKDAAEAVKVAQKLLGLI